MVLSNYRKFKIYSYLQEKVHFWNDRPSLLDRLECWLIKMSTLTFLLSNDESWEKEEQDRKDNL
jgi:hypothetical protein